MHDIKIPDSGNEPRGNPRGGKKMEFETAHIGGGSPKTSDFEAARMSESTGEAAAEPGEKVKVKFEKFVQLVATHDFEGVMKNHADEDIILSTNLLTDLANAHEEQPNENKKLPIFLIVGIIIGVVITYLVIRF